MGWRLNPTNNRGWVYAVFLVGTTLLAATLVVLIFTPRLAIWRGLEVREAQFNPEINRAAVTLQQLDEPFLDIAELNRPTNLGLAWRLLFPVTAHYLGFPRWLFLSLPHIGCLITLGLVAHLSWQVTSSAWRCFQITLLAAALPWFFVSTGWLAYFDSWWVLGLLIVGLVRTRLALGAACLLIPWVDERFVLALPLCAIVRGVYLYRVDRQELRNWLSDVMIVGVLTLPYVVIRIASMVGHDATADHFFVEWQRIESATAYRFVEGLWSGYRAAWVFVLAFVVISWQYRPAVALTLVLPAVVGTAIAGLVIAADLSRGLMMLLPGMLAGCLLLVRIRPALGGVTLSLVVVANLLLPASHVLWYFKVPIFSVFHEMRQLQAPPSYVNPHHYLGQGMQRAGEGRTEEAFHLFDNAVKLDPRLPQARIERALLLLKVGKPTMAGADIEEALRIQPLLSEGYFARGLLNFASGDRRDAIEDLNRALQLGGDEWKHRAECEQFLSRVRAGSSDLPTSTNPTKLP